MAEQITKVHQLILKGKIEVHHYAYGEYKDISIVGEDGYKRLLTGQLREFTLNYGKMINVRYYYSTDPIKDLTHAQQIVMHKLYGGFSADFTASQEGYSDVTQWMEYTTELKVGGHDLFKELESFEGFYVLIEIDDAPPPDQPIKNPGRRPTKAGKRKKNLPT